MGRTTSSTTESATPQAAPGRRRCCATPQLLFAVATFLIGAFVNSVAQAVLQYGDASAVPAALHDPGFVAMSPFVPTDAFYADLALFLMDGAAVVRFLTSARLRYVFARRRLFVQGVVFLARAASISATPLPNPYPHCQAPVVGSGAASTAILVMLGLVKTCNDVMFSGHAVSITLSALFLFWHCGDGVRPRHGWLRAALIAAKVAIVAGWALGLLTLVATKFHYSLDVLIGALIAALSFFMLYTAAALARLFDPDFAACPPEASAPVVAFVAWFERDARADAVADDGV